MSRRNSVLLLLLILFGWAGALRNTEWLVARVSAAPAPASDKATRYVVYLQGARVGSMVMTRSEARHEGKPAMREESESSLKLKVLGQDVEQQVGTSYLTDRTGHPLLLTMTTTSAGRTTVVRARFMPDRVECSLDAAGQKSTKTVPIPAGTPLIMDPFSPGEWLKKRLEVGAKGRYHFFEPITLTLREMSYEVAKREPREVGGKEVPAYLIRISEPLTGASEHWLDAEGNLLESTMHLGLRTVREDVTQSAQSGAPAQDLGEQTAVQTAVKLPAPRKTRSLRVKFSGIPDERLILADNRQQVAAREQADDAWTVTYQIEANALPAAALPLVQPAARRDAKFPGLEDAPYLGVNDASIQRQAAALLQGGGDRLAVARRIRAWVHRHLHPSNIGTLRAAPEIMRSRDGVCRDYATLAAALGRAAGIPSRVCAGIIYGEGEFYYHAWVEFQLQDGPDGWHPFDPTLGEDWVDATHIKFAQGDPADMFDAVQVMGKLQAEIPAHE